MASKKLKNDLKPLYLQCKVRDVIDLLQDMHEHIVENIGVASVPVYQRTTSLLTKARELQKITNKPIKIILNRKETAEAQLEQY